MARTQLFYRLLFYTNKFLEVFHGSGVMSGVYWCMGASIDTNVYIGGNAVIEPDLITIKHGTTINKNAFLYSHNFAARKLVWAPIKINSNVFVGCNTLIASVRNALRDLDICWLRRYCCIRCL